MRQTCDGENDAKYPAQAWRSGRYNDDDDVATICNYNQNGQKLCNKG